MIRAAAALLALAGACVVLTACDPGGAEAPVAPATEASSPEGRAALERIVAAERSCVYSGYIRTIHGEPGEGRATRMRVSRSGTGRSVLEWEAGASGGRCFEYASRFAWLDDPELLLANYRVSLAADAGPAVAWRETRRVSVTPRRDGRPSLELLVDAETWLVLRSDLRDFEGRIWLTTLFETLDYAADEPTPGGAERVTAPAAAAGRPLPLAVIRPLPGFVRVASEERPDGSVREDWSDGLAAFSLVQRAQPAASGAGELVRRTSAGRASVSGVFDGVLVTVTGNLPASDLEAVVGSLAAAE